MSFDTLMVKRKYSIDEKPYSPYLKVILFSFVIAVCVMVPSMITEYVRTGRFIFIYYGDYNAQQICFYEHCVDMVRSGGFQWDWLTDLGSNFMGSYSYYMLGSPFFWVLCLFPSTWTPYLMGPMYIIKFVAAAVIAYAYLKRFVKNRDYAVIGSLLYAFCGFQIYNVFFNQFQEVVALFPLLLLGMEELVQNDRKGLFAVAVALNAMCNYFMFAGQVVFCIVYFLFRLSDKSFNISLSKFCSLAFEAVIGFAMGMIIFLPGALALIGNDRLDRVGFKNIKDMFLYIKDNELYWQRYGQIYSSFFFPPDIPSRVNFFNGHAERWASLGGYLPMFSMTGVFAFFTTKKRAWLKGLLVFLLLCMVVPLFNSLFYLLNTSYYARWMYMLIFMMVLATVISLDTAKTRWKGALAIVTAVCTATFVPLGFIWYKESENTEFKLGYPPFIDRFWVYVLIAFAGIFVVWLLTKRYRGTPVFKNACLFMVAIFIVVYGNIHIYYGKCHSFSSDFMVNRAVEGEVLLPDTQDEFYRIDFFRTSSISTLDNLGIYWGYPSIECFHTVVPPSVMAFYPKIGVTRNVGSRAESSYYGLSAFTSVKYSFIESSKKSSFDEVGFEYLEDQNNFSIYENQNYLPMGFTYTEFMSETEFERINKKNRHIYLTKYLVVPDELVDYYSKFMTQVVYADRASGNEETYLQAVAERKQSVCSEFDYSSAGFDAKITLDKSNVVFFSVPYDGQLFEQIETGGWKAYVNGEEREVLCVTYGFVAVECGEGENNIEFRYETQGLKLGIICTVSGIFILALYLLFFRFIKKRKPEYKFFKENYYDDCGTEKLDIAAVEFDLEQEDAEQSEELQTPFENNESTITAQPENSATDESEEDVDNTID